MTHSRWYFACAAALGGLAPAALGAFEILRSRVDTPPGFLFLPLVMVGFGAAAVGVAMGFALALKPASREPIRSVVEPCFAPISDIDEFGRFTESIWFGGKDGELDIRQISIMALGLTGETGEVAELLKKLLRDGKLDLEHLRKELGDVAYYWARICLAFGFKPSEVLGVNRAKLLDRLERGVLSGSGDNR